MRLQSAAAEWTGAQASRLHSECAGLGAPASLQAVRAHPARFGVSRPWERGHPARIFCDGAFDLVRVADIEFSPAPTASGLGSACFRSKSPP